ncbi:MAG: phosphate ABC transporter substrate-binding protein [Gammaproteobacteria bacterium]|nr:phosphate ABC transporter substrate-binding protein [Gammaproteobacteria bacterium]
MKLKALVCGAALMIISGQVMAGMVVVAGSGSDIPKLTQEQVKDVFLGKNKNIKGLDMPDGSSIRNQFIEKVIGKSESQFKAYWSQKIFSGKGVPPKIVETSAEAKQMVNKYTNSIGYMDSSQVDASVKVVYTVN